MNIDMHAHFVPEGLLDDLAARRHSFPSVSATGDKTALRIAFGSQEPKRPMPGAMSDVERRQRRLSEQGIEKQVVAGWLDWVLSVFICVYLWLISVLVFEVRSSREPVTPAEPC